MFFCLEKVFPMFSIECPSLSSSVFRFNPDIPTRNHNFEQDDDLSNELNDTTGLLDLALGFLADVASLDNDGDFRETALSEDLGVTQREEVEDNGLVGGSLASNVLFAGLLGDERPELLRKLAESRRTISSHHDNRFENWRIDIITLSRLMVGFQ